MTEEQKPMTGAHLQEFQSLVRAEVMRVLDDIKIRQWAVEQTTKLSSSVVGQFDVKKMAEFFYNFATNKENDDDKTS